MLKTLRQRFKKLDQQFVIILVLILVQLLLIGIIFLQNKQEKQTLDLINQGFFNLNKNQVELTEKVNNIQSGQMMMQSQIYRMIRPDDKNEVE